MEYANTSPSNAELRVIESLAAAAPERPADMFGFHARIESSRRDIRLVPYRVHAVFEGSYPSNSERVPYRPDPVRDLGMPRIEFILPPDPATGFEEVACSAPAAALLGLDGAGGDIRAMARGGGRLDLGRVALTEQQTAELADWVDRICQPIMEAHRDPAAFAVAMADRYNLLYESQDTYSDPADQERFDGLLYSDGAAAIRAVAAARGDAMSSDREVSAFMQTLDAAGRRLELELDGPMARPAATLAELRDSASTAAAATRAARASGRAPEPEPR